MSGTFTAFNFNSGFGLPFTVFTPVYWAPQNTQGAPSGSSPSDVFGGAISQGPGITPNLLAAAQANLAFIAENGLASVTASGANSQAVIGNAFSTWGSQLQDLAQQNANSFSEAVNKSAKACSGFFGCLFGF